MSNPTLADPRDTDIGHAAPVAKETMEIAVVIPAYKPEESLVRLVKDLLETPVAGIIVVDDGSGPAYREVFGRLPKSEKIEVCRHAVNLGKGAALRTGMNAAANRWPDLVGVVTADADGQHLVKDILAVASELNRERSSLIMGSRRFAGDVPLRSKFGNLVTVGACRILLGMKLTDTQTGLRGIPHALIERLLKLSSRGYEFELDMLLVNKYAGGRIREVLIETVYLEGNKSSHFSPVMDSARIYFTLLRFTLTSIATAILDYTVFVLALTQFGLSVGWAQSLARLVAMFFNYTAVRRVVFYSHRKHRTVFPRYALLVVISGFVSFGLMTFFFERLHLRLTLAKLVAEGIVFLANFAIQRDFIFGAPRVNTTGDTIEN